MEKMQAGIFDVGGVLHAGGSIGYIIKDISHTLSITQEQVRDAWEHVTTPLLATGQVDEAEHWRIYQAYTHAPHSAPPESLFIREFRRHFRPHRAVLGMVHQLRNDGIKLAVLSNTIKTHADFLEKKGMYAAFDVRVLSHEVGLLKPDPKIWEITLDRLGVAPDQAFFVDDTAENLDVPAKMGMEVILYENPKQLRKALKEHKLVV